MVNESPCKPATLRQATSADLECLVDFNKAMAKVHADNSIQRRLQSVMITQQNWVQETEGIDLAQHALQAGVAAVLADHAKGAYHVAEVCVLAFKCHQRWLSTTVLYDGNAA